jgi:tetratricopeptide (TPR) repeat protein
MIADRMPRTDKILRLPTRLGSYLPIFLLLAVLAPQAFADDVKDVIRKATKLTRAGVADEAEKLLRDAVAVHPDRSSLRVELAYVLVKQRRLTESYDLAFPVAKNEPRNARAFAVLGAVMLVGGRFNEARTLFYNALKLDRDQHLAWAGVGMVDFYENRMDSSVAYLNEAVYQEPNEPDYVFTLAQVSARSERYRQAADAYQRFLRISRSTDTDRRARIKGLIKFLEFLGSADGLYKSTGSEETAGRFDLVGNRPVIKIRVNGRQKELDFVLDTGSGISVISDETAKLLNIRPIARGGHARGIGGDGKFEIVYGRLAQLDIGDVKIKNVPVFIRQFHYSPEEKKVDGYIGIALISKFLTTIDYGTNTFSLTRSEAGRKAFIAEDETSVPLRLTSSGFLSGEVQLDGIEGPLNFIVDTGASVSVISRPVSNDDTISKHLKTEKLRIVGSAGITDDVPTFMLPKVSFGKHSMESVKAVALDLDLINEASGFEQGGILGGNFLKNYRLTFDFRNSKISFVLLKSDKP